MKLSEIKWQSAELPPRDAVDGNWNRRRALKKLFEVGNVLRTESGQMILVGDVNELGGECDCCGWVENFQDPIVEWAKVWPEE